MPNLQEKIQKSLGSMMIIAGKRVGKRIGGKYNREKSVGSHDEYVGGGKKHVFKGPRVANTLAKSDAAKLTSQLEKSK
jgi:hypothetical protein